MGIIDWDQRPASAQFIKLIQFGAYLQDSSMLKGTSFSSVSYSLWLLGQAPSSAQPGEPWPYCFTASGACRLLDSRWICSRARSRE